MYALSDTYEAFDLHLNKTGYAKDWPAKIQRQYDSKINSNLVETVQILVIHPCSLFFDGLNYSFVLNSYKDPRNTRPNRFSSLLVVALIFQRRVIR